MSHSTLTAGLASLIGLSTLWLASPSQAFGIKYGGSINNGSFETGDFTGWEILGDASVQTSAFGSGPTSGTYQALLNTEATPDDNYSSLEQFLNLNSGALDRLGNGEVFGGSAIRQIFTANAGDTLSFNWNFLTNEELPSANNDFAFVVTLSDTSNLANTYATFFPSSTPFANETGFQPFSQKVSTTGSYTLGIGVVNVADSEVQSGLLLDNFTLKPQNNDPKGVPEPLTIVGSGMALGFGALFKKQSSKGRNKLAKH